jgi:hypothetical protein
MKIILILKFKIKLLIWILYGFFKTEILRYFQFMTYSIREIYKLYNNIIIILFLFLNIFLNYFIKFIFKFKFLLIK